MYFEFIILILLIVLLFGVFFFGLNYYSKGQAYQDGKKTKYGLLIMVSPFIILFSYIFIFFLYEKVSFKPTKNDLVGKYKIVEVDNVNRNQSITDQYNFELLENGTFQIQNIPMLEICDKGNYKLNYFDSEGRINFDCVIFKNYANIVSGINSFEIEFKIGDYDSEGYIRLGKIND